MEKIQTVTGHRWGKTYVSEDTDNAPLDYRGSVCFYVFSGQLLNPHFKYIFYIFHDV